MKLDRFLLVLRQQISLQMMVIPGILFLLIFAYIPLFNILIAFQHYSIVKGVFGSQWVGLKNFGEMFLDPIFWEAAWNTISLSAWGIILGFPAPIILALIINEIPFKRYKKFVQTSSYLPHFISMVVVATMWAEFLDPKGIINTVLVSTGILKEPIFFLAEINYYRITVTLIGVWKGIGWGSIVYLAAISGIDPQIYEAAIIDGASRLRRIRSITLPNMVGIISTLFILGIAGLVRGSLDNSVLFGNGFNRSVSYVIEHYTLDMGLALRRYSFSTAVGLFQSILALLLVLITNWGSGKLGGRRIF